MAHIGHGLQKLLGRSWLDGFTLMLVATVVVASLLPARQEWAHAVDRVGQATVILLFFLHGAKLPRELVISGIGHWRLHLLTLSGTFLLFPVIGLALRPVQGFLLDPMLWAGLLFLCCLPSTVQSSITFTSIAKGNVPAAICAASASNMLGVILTPLLTGLLLSKTTSLSLDSIWSIAGQILLPFILGQLLRRWIGAWVVKQKALLSVVDRGSVLIMVYAAFGHAVVEGIWQKIAVAQLVVLTILCGAILAIVIIVMRTAARRLGFDSPDEAAIVFCGSKKSLITGMPMANVLFSAGTVGAIALPMIIFHQMQLIVCAVLARRYARRADDIAKADTAPGRTPSFS